MRAHALIPSKDQTPKITTIRIAVNMFVSNRHDRLGRVRDRNRLERQPRPPRQPRAFEFETIGVVVAIPSLMQRDIHSRASTAAFIKNVHGLRYQVKDVARAVAFYTERLGFTLKHQQLPAFANVSLGAVDVLLSGPGASGSRPMPDGQQQQPGGWNRLVLQVADLPAAIAACKESGLTLRNEMEVGPGGRQIQIEDPDGNPIELFEPAAR
jgi:glyoxylase I family protein